MACGCPVLCSTTGSLSEVVGDAALPVEPENTDRLKTELTRLATDHGLRKRLRADGLKQAQRFNWQTTAAATLDVYARAMMRAKTA